MLLAGQITFLSPYQGRTVRGTVGSSSQFNWSFSGDARLIEWGLPLANDLHALDNKQILFQIFKDGTGSATTSTAYVQRVAGSLSQGLATFTLSNLRMSDAKVYVCRINPSNPSAVKLTDNVELVVEGKMKLISR